MVELKKFVTPCELPSPYERELLTILMEECAEVQQRASKLLRFGRDEIQHDQPLTNSERLSQEIGDVFALVELCRDAKLVSMLAIMDQKPLKLKKLQKYMQAIGS